MTLKSMGRGIGATAVAFLVGAGLTACEGEEGPGGSSSEGDSTHNTGRNCIECHGKLEYAGTIYSNASGSSTVSGAKVIITEADGATRTLTSDQTGNFYTEEGNPEDGYAVAVEGNTVQMSATATNGGCNVSGCHDGSATARVHTN